MSNTTTKENYNIDYNITDSLLSIDIFDTKTGKKYSANKNSSEYSVYQNIGIDIFDNIHISLIEGSFLIKNNLDSIDITFICGQVKLTIGCELNEDFVDDDILGLDLKSSLIKISKELAKCKTELAKVSSELEKQKTLVNTLRENPVCDYVYIEKCWINKNKKHLIVLSRFDERMLNVFVKLKVNDIIYGRISLLDYKNYHFNCTSTKIHFNCSTCTIPQNVAARGFLHYLTGEHKKAIKKTLNYILDDDLELPYLLIPLQKNEGCTLDIKKNTADE